METLNFVQTSKPGALQSGQTKATKHIMWKSSLLSGCAYQFTAFLWVYLHWLWALHKSCASQSTWERRKMVVGGKLISILATLWSELERQSLNSWDSHFLRLKIFDLYFTLWLLHLLLSRSMYHDCHCPCPDTTCLTLPQKRGNAVRMPSPCSQSLGSFQSVFWRAPSLSVKWIVRCTQECVSRSAL